MTPRQPGTPEMGASAYAQWLAAGEGVSEALDELCDAIASALPDDAAEPLIARVRAVEELFVAREAHAEAAFKALAAALLPRPSSR